MGFLSGLGSMLSNFGGGLSLHDASFGWSDYSARQSATKDSLRKSMAASQAMSRWEAENMPSYTVTGLRNAGLNPILAAGSVASPMQLSAQHPPSQGNSTPLSGLTKKESQIASATLDQINASTAKINAEKKAVLENAQVNRVNSETNQWQLYDAKSIGAGGFNVQFLGRGFGGSGESRVIHTLRVNKVTGEAYDALTGQKVRVIGEVSDGSAKQSAPSTYNQYNYNYNNYRDYEAIKHHDWSR